MMSRLSLKNDMPLRGMKVENYEDEDDCFIDFETEFPSIVFDNTLTALSSEPTVCPPNENKIDFRISLDESDDEDYTVIFDENSFLYKIVSINDLKTDSRNDNGKNNMPSSPKPTVDYLDDLDFFKNFKNEFPAIVYNNAQTSKSGYLTEPSLNPQHIDEFNLNNETSLSKYDKEEQNDFHFNDLFLFNIIHPDDLKSEKDHDDNNINIIQSSEDMAPLPAADQRHPWLRYQVKGYTEGIIHSYEQRLETIWSRPVNRVHVLDFKGLTPRIRQDLAVRLRMVYTGEGQQEGSDRLIPDKGDLRDYWIKILSVRDFLDPAPSYVLIRDPVRRLCYRMIAYSIFGRGQAPEKVTDVDLLYLCSMDQGTTNVPHLLAQYLFRHAEGRKSRSGLSGGHFIGRLAMHFGLVSDEGLRGLQVVTRELPLIDLHKLGRLNICLRFGDTWAWVAQGIERQQADAAGAYKADEAGPAVDEGTQEIPAPAQAPPPPLPAP
ncbi:hypothetical protein Tco_0926035 [Tanacetum coccineum]|uniref:Uncharacterized protein n=1 Tax=Tanacetum coccineum TaxID=301880 RepID=A0ABQ5D8K7_9ASTR